MSKQMGGVGAGSAHKIIALAIIISHTLDLLLFLELLRSAQEWSPAIRLILWEHNRHTKAT